MDNEDLVQDTRSLEERLETTIALAMAQIDAERNSANRDAELMRRLEREINRCF